MSHEIVQRAEDRMKKSLESLKADLMTIRTGKATPVSRSKRENVWSS